MNSLVAVKAYIQLKIPGLQKSKEVQKANSIANVAQVDERHDPVPEPSKDISHEA